MNRYSKLQCLDKDWNNPKEISTEDLANCILEYGLNTDDIPEARRVAVDKEIIKLQEQKQKENTRELIKIELVKHKHIYDGSLFANFDDIEIEYYLDPDLFETSFEAVEAMAELSSCWDYEMRKTEEYGYKYKNPRTYNRDMNRMIKAMDNLRKQYIRLGGLETEFNKYVSQIPAPMVRTLKQDVYAQRERIKEHFIFIGVSPTRADKIATAITQKAYQELK